MARRYFQSHGPARLQDYLWWSGLTAGEARAGLDGIRADLVEVDEVADGDIDNAKYWMMRNSPAAQGASAEVHLLPGFDEYLLGYTQRGLVLQSVHNARVIHSNGIFRATVLVDGQIIGTWARQTQPGGLLVTLELFAPLAKRRRPALAEAAARLSHFAEQPVKIVL